MHNGPPARAEGGARRRGGLGRAWSDWVASKWPVLRFVGVFGLLIGVFYALYLPFSGEEGVFRSYLVFLAKTTTAILRFLGQDVTTDGRSIVEATRIGVRFLALCS